ncbi:hypothetical protein C2R22_01150 [Salinigranum rubrum]|uniref:HTH iclR-type domain-containing protein n=1 Tax=Salinigranum rubrum TaxID=755307 RepID=A0A2I8VEU8_9EURY|nr:hypothetical protein [Salinigranum rubrum]AUV80435.1 hypothetical protein C2R22_01150 [Salinigranum rubrum]
MRSAALTLALLIILSGAAPATALVPPGVDDGQEHAPAAAFATAPAVAQVESDALPSTAIQVQLRSDTDARWTVTYRYPLTGADEIEAFRTLGAEFENGQTDLGLDASVFRNLATEAAESTGRSMVIRDVAREATVERNATVANGTVTAAPTATPTPENETAAGVLRLSFTWTNFLERTDDGTLQLGDVFRTGDGGTWLSSLGDDQRLTIVTPPGYVISRTSFPIQQQNGSLIIDGPREFSEAERLSVTYRASDQAELPWTLIVGGGVAAVVVVAVAFVLVRSRDTRGGGSPEPSTGQAMTNGGESAEEQGETGSGGGAETGTGATPEPTSPDGATAGPVAGAGDDGETAGDEGDEPDPEPDFDLLSDEERVEYLLEQRGGRMKQANIVKETGWSDAKVSQLLSSMAETGRVEKLRLGRENLISLPDEGDDDGDE